MVEEYRLNAISSIQALLQASHRHDRWGTFAAAKEVSQAHKTPLALMFPGTH